MKQVAFHYGHGKITHSFSEELVGVLESAINTYTPPATDKELIEQAMAAPIACSPLSALAKGKDKIVIIASDHTRPQQADHSPDAAAAPAGQSGCGYYHSDRHRLPQRHHPGRVGAKIR